MAFVILFLISDKIRFSLARELWGRVSTVKANVGGCFCWKLSKVHVMYTRRLLVLIRFRGGDVMR